MPPAVRLTKPWQDLNRGNVERIGGHLGVYELAGPQGETVFIGWAGGRSAFGLRGELLRHLAAVESGRPGGETKLRFRVEVTMGYWSRYKELLMVHLHDHGRLPRDNTDDPSRLGRLSLD